MSIVILSCSLNPDSKSRILAHEAAKSFPSAEVIDMRDHPLPLCDGFATTPDNLEALRSKITKARAIVFAIPIYNYTANAVAKNVIEWIGRDPFADKVVGLICSAGGQGSYMAIGSFAISLLLDFHCTIAPQIVYATGEAFDGAKLKDPEVKERLHLLAQKIEKLTK